MDMVGFLVLRMFLSTGDMKHVHIFVSNTFRRLTLSTEFRKVRLLPVGDAGKTSWGT